VLLPRPTKETWVLSRLSALAVVLPLQVVEVPAPTKSINL
jgi:hypothetical protein